MKNLILCRKVANKTQKEMAEIFGISRQAYANYEIGNREPDFETLNKIANYFNVSTDYLLGRTDEPRIKEKPTKDDDLDGLSEDEKLFIDLLRKIPDADRPAVDRVIRAFVQEDSE